jgi:hypothetical protein
MIDAITIGMAIFYILPAQLLYMKRFGTLAFASLLIGLLMPLASAQLPTPDVTFIPSQVSINSSFLIVVDPKVDDSIRATWFAPPYGFGQIPRIGDNWVCYFSDTDSKSICGPSPFRYAGISYPFEVNTTDFSGNTGGRTMDIVAGGVELVTDVITSIENSSVDMAVYPSTTVTGVSYETYYTGNLTIVPGKSGSLTKQVYAYVGNIDLDPNEYYIAFSAATGGGDYGGSVARVDTRIGGNGNGGTDTGYVTVDPVDLNILIEKNQRYEKSNFRITNLKNQTFSSLSIHIPSTTPIDVNDFLDIIISNNTLGPHSSMYFSVVLENVVNYMEIKIQAQLRSNSTLIGYMPIDIMVSVKNESGTTMTTCSGKSDGSDCYGGICCGDVCRKKANCCDDNDCSSDEGCQNYACIKTGGNGGTPDVSCTTGTCYAGQSSCPSGEDWTGTCRESEVDGVCCEVSVNECEGQSDATSCRDGLCCSEECVVGDCCDDIDCSAGYTCSYNYCAEIEAPAFDFTIIIIIVVIIVLAGIGALYYLKRVKKGGGGEGEFEGSSEEFDEEFY